LRKQSFQFLKEAAVLLSSLIGPFLYLIFLPAFWWTVFFKQRLNSTTTATAASRYAPCQFTSKRNVRPSLRQFSRD